MEETPVAKNWIFNELTRYSKATRPKQIYPKIKITFIGDNTVCAFYRIVKPAVELTEAGLISPLYLEDIKPEHKDIALASADLIVIERPWDKRWLDLIPKLKYSGIGVIVETDDWIDGIKTANLGKVNLEWYQERVDTYNNTLSLADCIVTTTEAMRDSYEKKFGVRTFLAPNQVDFDYRRWDFPINNDDKQIILFVGPTHQDDLSLIEDAVNQVLERNLDASIKLIGTPPEWLYMTKSIFEDRVIIDHSWSDIFQYPKHLMQSGSIVLIPLINNEFNSIGKSDLKYLEATMTGKTCVASPVGVYKKTIQNNKNGFLANSTEDWIKYIELLLNKPKLRKRILEAAVSDVTQNRQYQHNINLWYSAFEYTYTQALPRKKLALEIANDRSKHSGIIVPSNYSR